MGILLLSQPFPGTAVVRVSQLLGEVVCVPLGSPVARVTQLLTETGCLSSTPISRISQLLSSLVALPPSPLSRVSQLLGESTVAELTTVQVYQCLVEILMGDIIEPPWEPDRFGTTVGLVWDELRDIDNILHCHTDIARAINDPATYYGGRKVPKVITWGEIERALSDYRGEYEGASFSIQYSDLDYALRILHADKVLQGASLVIRTATQETRLALDYARTLVRGIVSQPKPQAERKFELVCTDVLSSHFGPADSERQIPRRTLSRVQFPDLPTELIGTAEPIIYGELSDEGSSASPPVITGLESEGAFYESGWFCGYGPIYPASGADIPTNVQVTAQAGGNLPIDIPDAKYGVIVTAVDDDGKETDPEPFYYNQANNGSRGTFPPIVPTVVLSAGFQTARVTWTASANAVKYRIYLATYYYGAQFSQYIEVNDPTTTVDFTNGPAWGDFPKLDNITPGASLPPWSSWGGYYVTANMSDGETSVSQQVCNGKLNPYRRTMRVRWLPVTGAISYNVYRQPGCGIPLPPSAVDHKWTVMAGTEYLDDDWQDTGATIISGMESPMGRVPIIYIGTYLRNGETKYRFLVAAHAVKEILGLYLDGVRIDSGTFGTSWFVPGYDAEPMYTDVNGRRYCFIGGQGTDASAVADGSKKLTANVRGIETVGDGSGSLITKIPVQELHFLQNFGFSDWQTGAWLVTPHFPADPPPEEADVVDQIDETSFAATVSVTDALITGGLVGGGMFGANGEFITLREALARFHISGSYQCGINRKTQFMVSAFDSRAAAWTNATKFTEAREINAKSFDIEDLDTEHFTVWPYSYNYDYARQKWLGTTEKVDEDAVDRYGRKVGQELQLWFITGTVRADEVIGRQLTRTADPPRRVKFSTPAIGLNIDLGDSVYVTHTDGVGPNGWILQKCRVVRHISQPETLGTQLVLEDVHDHVS